MKLFERIKSIFPARKKAKEEEQPQAVLAVNEPSTSPHKEVKKADRFTIVSWSVTSVLVVALLSGTLY